MARPRKIVKDPDDEKLIDKEAVLDIIAEAIQVSCGIPGCSPKFHRVEAQRILNRLRDHDLIKEV